MTNIKNYLVLAVLLLSTSCVETVLLGSGATFVTLRQKKSIEEVKNDVTIEAKINYQFLLNGLKKFNNKIGVTVNQQRVLLTGSVNDENLIKNANKIAWKVDGVMEVIDEIQFDNNDFLKKAQLSLTDSAITAQINYKMATNSEINSINFEAITVNQIVYLVGLAKNKKELKAVNLIASKTSGVKKVISHILLAKN